MTGVPGRQATFEPSGLNVAESGMSVRDQPGRAQEGRGHGSVAPSEPHSIGKGAGQVNRSFDPHDGAKREPQPPRSPLPQLPWCRPYPSSGDGRRPSRDLRAPPFWTPAGHHSAKARSSCGDDASQTGERLEPVDDARSGSSHGHFSHYRASNLEGPRSQAAPVSRPSSSSPIPRLKSESTMSLVCT